MNEEVIYQLECSLLDPSVRSSNTQLDLLLADEFIEFGSSGEVYSKNEVMKYLPLEKPQTHSVEDFVVTALAPNVMLATYKVTSNSRISLRSSIWRFNETRWEMIFHQGTPMKSIIET